MAVIALVEDRIRRIPAPVPGLHLFALELRPGPDDATAAALGPEDRQRLTTLRPEDARRLLARRALVRTAVAALGGCSAAAVRVGSPGPWQVEVPDGTGWYFSSSSSGDHAFLALADVPVGADVEAEPGPPDALLVSGLLLAPAEHAWIRAGAAEVGQRFLRTWVRKEAVVKCTGEGMSRDLRSFVVDAAVSSAPVVSARGTPLGIRTHAVQYPGHVAAVAHAA